uniref:Ankyrin repeat domain 33 n=1 Tax=Molossus molossus TaxID=27622 RepID=A0A7J8FV68_MOLMO|nr:ankyrin repeat domain 33 [Molossus molossus]
MSEAPYCPDSETPAPDCRLGALYWACVRNDSAQLQAMLDDGVSPEEATQVDGNGRTGLMIACYHGFGGVVALLSRCPFLDVNQQDKEGDTALMLAVQAGHVPLVSLLLNYYLGVDLERRDQRGLTALMKAAIRDRSECVAALLMAGTALLQSGSVPSNPRKLLLGREEAREHIYMGGQKDRSQPTALRNSSGRCRPAHFSPFPPRDRAFSR